MVLNLRTGQGQKIMKPVLIYVLDERTGQGQKIMKPRGLEIPIIDIDIPKEHSTLEEKPYFLNNLTCVCFCYFKLPGDSVACKVKF